MPNFLLEKISKEKKRLSTEQKAGLGSTIAGVGAIEKARQYEKSRSLTYDPKSKNIAIVYPGGKVGQGHAQPAKALQDYYSRKGYKVDLLDVQKHHPKLVEKAITNQYGPSVASNPVAEMPTVTKADPGIKPGETLPEAIKAGKKPRSLRNSKTFRYLWNKVPRHDKVLKEMSGKPYSKFIAMHGTTSEVLKNKGVPVDLVLTDTVQDPFAWRSESATKFHVPTQDAKKRYMATGVDAKNINVTDSLVVKEKFKNPDKMKMPDDIAKIRKGKKGKKVITIAGGGEGIQVDDISKIVADKYKGRDDVEIFAVTAKNKKAKKGLEKFKAKNNAKNLKVLGFVDDLGERMNYSDLVITRPGGSTTGELLHLGTPTITYNHGDIAKGWQEVGNHEHGNVKTLSEEGFSRHFQTKHNNKPGGKINSDIINPGELKNILDDVDKNYDTLKAKGQQAAKKFRQTRPEESILNSKHFKKPIKKLTGTTKALGALGAAGVLAGGALVVDDYLEKKSEVDKEKLKENAKTTAKIVGGTTAAAWGLGMAASRGLPGLRGGRGMILGPLKATKNIAGAAKDVATHAKSMDQVGADLIGLKGQKAFRVKLDPEEIVNVSETLLKNKMGDEAFSALSKKEIRQKAKRFDAKSSIKILANQEAKAKKGGYDVMYGFTHFDPKLSSRMGYSIRTDLVEPKGVKRLFGSNRSFLNYYGKGKQEATKKLREGGVKNLKPIDAYFLTAPTENLNLYTKNLKDSPKQAVEKATKRLQKSKYNYDPSVETEFKSQYNELVSEIKS